MRRTGIFGLIAGLISITGAVFAAPSLLGPTGAFALPNADVERQGQVSFGLKQVGQQDNWEATRTFQTIYGVAHNTEIGLRYNDQSYADYAVGIDEDGNPDRSRETIYNWSINTKYVMSFSYSGTKWAAGGTCQRIRGNGYGVTTSELYLVGTKDFNIGSTGYRCRATAGMAWIFEKLHDNYREESEDEYYSDDSPFGSLELILPNRISVVYELLKTDYASIDSFAIRVPVNDTLSFELGQSESFRGLGWRSNQTTVLGLNYEFGAL